MRYASLTHPIDCCVVLLPRDETEKQSPFFRSGKKGFSRIDAWRHDPHPNPPHKGEGIRVVTFLA